MKENDIYAISGRIKNIIAREDIALSESGNVLVNYFSLMFKDLYDLSEKMPKPYSDLLSNLLSDKESIPYYIVKVSSPKEKTMSLYDQTMNSRLTPEFSSPGEALIHFVKEYEDLGAEYGMSGDDFWLEAESSSRNTEDYQKIRRLSRQIQMSKHLIEKNKNG